MVGLSYGWAVVMIALLSISGVVNSNVSYSSFNVDDIITFGVVVCVV